MSSISQMTHDEEKELNEWYGSNKVTNIIQQEYVKILDEDNKINEWIVKKEDTYNINTNNK
jgi:hypothetical protein